MASPSPLPSCSRCSPSDSWVNASKIRLRVLDQPLELLLLQLEGPLLLVVLDGHARDPERLLDEAALGLGRGPGLLVVQGEGAQHLAVLSVDGGRPAGPEPVLKGKVAVPRTLLVGRNVLDHDGLVVVRRRPAGADARPDSKVVDGVHEGLGQARGAAVVEGLPLGVQQEHGAEEAGATSKTTSPESPAP